MQTPNPSFHSVDISKLLISAREADQQVIRAYQEQFTAQAKEILRLEQKLEQVKSELDEARTILDGQALKSLVGRACAEALP